MSGLVPLGVDLMRLVDTTYESISQKTLLCIFSSVWGFEKVKRKSMLTRLRSEIAQQIDSFGGKKHKKYAIKNFIFGR